MRKVFLWMFAGFLAVSYLSASFSYAGTTKAASVDSAGNLGNGESIEPAISADGRYVVFISLASNLAQGASNGKSQIFIHDRKTRKTTLVSKNRAGEPGDNNSSQPAISADGRYVAFASTASNLAPGVTNGKVNVFVHDKTTGETTIISKNNVGEPGNNHSNQPALSSNGRYIAFVSWAGNLVPDFSKDFAAVYVYDRLTDELKLISKNSDGKPAEGPSNHPSISADGRYVAFESQAGNLMPGDTSETNGKSNIFVHDRQTRETNIVSKNGAGKPGNDISLHPSISADGRYVAFESSAHNLVTGDTNDKDDIFIHDRRTGETKLISKGSDGKPADGASSLPAISADGMHIAFESEASNLVKGDRNGKADAFLYDIKTGKTRIISVSSTGAQGNERGCITPAINADGRYVAFESEASNLVAGDTNGKSDIFIRDNR